ncbi:MAG TPA: pitrilysin family protein, partial [Pyrinomonadaceae bacterium]|nr:pitrilysin family protein [Pyrinomonadaceae bacterium]
MRANTAVLFCLFATFIPASFAQEKPPAPGAPRSVSIPAVVEKKLPNGLTVATVQRTNVPLVTMQLVIRSGAGVEPGAKAGLADLTASMLTKGTKTRTATQVAEDVEFLGGAIQSGAGWNSSFVAMTVTSDKAAQAMALLGDVILNPKFDQKELDLLRSQYLDGLTANLKQPGFIANFVATKYSFGEHPAGGTPASLAAITRDDVVNFHRGNFAPENAVLIFTGNITLAAAASLAAATFGKWRRLQTWGDPHEYVARAARGGDQILVVDLPKSGQASVVYTKPLTSTGRQSAAFYPAVVLNSVLGGGYSSRLNLEIRIKRGLSYGAGSSFVWRTPRSNFATRTQTKNQSAAEVADLILDEVKKLTKNNVGKDELVPRKSVLTGTFGRGLETTTGLASALADLYVFGIPTNELNTYVTNVNNVSDSQIKGFAAGDLMGGDIIIVGDYSIFKDDLAKRFPKSKITVI